MDKEQTLNQFWNSFGVPAYDAITMPSDEEMIRMGKEPFPRITYDVTINGFGIPTSLFASIWDKSTSWGRITGLAHEVDSSLSEGGQMVSYENGALWIKKGNPFQQRMGDPDDTIRRIIVNIEIEYLEG